MVKKKEKEAPASTVAGTAAVKLPSKRKLKTTLRKAPQAPKRFKSNYILFFEHVQEAIRAELDGKSSAPAVSKKASVMWRNITPEEREHWDKEALKEKERYLAEKAAYTGPWQVPHKRAKKDPSAPKRNPSAFLLYSQDRRKQLKLTHPGLKNTEISQILGKDWRAASEEDKRPHIEREQKERIQYKIEMENWRQKQASSQNNNEKKEEAEQIQMTRSSIVVPPPVATPPPVVATGDHDLDLDLGNIKQESTEDQEDQDSAINGYDQSHTTSYPHETPSSSSAADDFNRQHQQYSRSFFNHPQQQQQLPEQGSPYRNHEYQQAHDPRNFQAAPVHHPQQQQQQHQQYSQQHTYPQQEDMHQHHDSQQQPPQAQHHPPPAYHQQQQPSMHPGEIFYDDWSHDMGTHESYENTSEYSTGLQQQQQPPPPPPSQTRGYDQHESYSPYPVYDTSEYEPVPILKVNTD